jgi:hypothetical protein
MFQEHLRRQLQFIAASCEEFDAGRLEEAVRIAQALRVIFHQTGKSTSLLKHLGATTINLLTTQEEIGPEQEHRVGLSDFRCQLINGEIKTEYGPTLSLEHARPVPVSKWWNQVVVVLDARTRITRQSLTLDAANYDGGAHVANKLPTRYGALADVEQSALTFTVNGAAHQVPALEAKYVVLRQIGFEVLNSPELQSLCGPSGAAFGSVPAALPRKWPTDGTVIRAISIKHKH